VFLAVGVGLFAGFAQGEKKRAELMTYGRRVKGCVTRVKRNVAIRVNRRHPWQAEVRCLHPLTGQEITVRSHNLWVCPVKEGDSVDVLFDPMDEKKYAVDVTDEEAMG